MVPRSKRVAEPVQMMIEQKGCGAGQILRQEVSSTSTACLGPRDNQATGKSSCRTIHRTRCARLSYNMPLADEC